MPSRRRLVSKPWRVLQTSSRRRPPITSSRHVLMGSRRVELGSSMNAWMRAMGLQSAGGMTCKLIAEQARRISACNLSFVWDMAAAEVRKNGTFVDTAIHMKATDERQTALWQDEVVLNEAFYQSLKAHPVPVLEC